MIIIYLLLGGKKINKSVDFSETLNLKNYLSNNHTVKYKERFIID